MFDLGFIHKRKYLPKDLWWELANEIREEKGFVCQMSNQDHAFLAGLIRNRKPQKVVEIGVAEG